jgi:hypothetical protein
MSGWTPCPLEKLGEKLGTSSTTSEPEPSVPASESLPEASLTTAPPVEPATTTVVYCKGVKVNGDSCRQTRGLDDFGFCGVHYIQSPATVTNLQPEPPADQASVEGIQPDLEPVRPEEATTMSSEELSDSDPAEYSFEMAYAFIERILANRRISNILACEMERGRYLLDPELWPEVDARPYKGRRDDEMVGYESLVMSDFELNPQRLSVQLAIAQDTSRARRPRLVSQELLEAMASALTWFPGWEERFQ